ncbi:UNVERIFIED_CONTAM: hypothetical protein Sradi_3611600 [Sesamum radiatum]|uniref:Uncharacterized protein n=1 Tax=Sesamum radiatum TaxID=300843 RepID=A0AAW2QHH9_SESRA
MLGLTQSSYIEKVLKRFTMSKRLLPSMRHGIKLSKKQSPKTDEELKRMSNMYIPYASAVGSIQYAVQCNELISDMRWGGALGRGQEHS